MKLQVPVKSDSSENDKLNLDWDDLVFRIKHDSFRVYFIKTPEAEVKKKVELCKGIEAALDENGKKVHFISFLDLNQLGFHLFDFPGDIDRLHPMSLHCKYHPKEDVLVIYFVYQSPTKDIIRSRQAKEPFGNIIFDLHGKRIISMEVNSASKILKKKDKTNC
jgi:hypothetical protein